MSTEEDELQRNSSVSEYDEDEDDDDTDSGAGSDDFDLFELGEIGEELCQVGNRYCSIPLELYDLPDLTEILSVDSWNNYLTEEERFSLAEYLPALDQGEFMCTLKELFSAGNFHFGSPLVQLFNMLKGGLCEPRVAIYHQTLKSLQKRTHYHQLQNYQNSMVASLIQVKDAWKNCYGYGIGERLRVLNLMRSEKSLVYEKMEDSGLETDSSGREESVDGLWTKRVKDIRLGSKMGGRAVSTVSPTMDLSSLYGKRNAKGILKFAGSKVPSVEELMCRFPSSHHGLETRIHQEPVIWYDSRTARGYKKTKVGLIKQEKKHEHLKSEDGFNFDSFRDMPWSLKNDTLDSLGRNRCVDQTKGVGKLTKKQINERTSFDYNFQDAGKKGKYFDLPRQHEVEDRMNTAKNRAQHLLLKGNQEDWLRGTQPFRPGKIQTEDFSMDRPRKFDDWDIRSKKWKMGPEFQTGINHFGHDPKIKSYSAFPPQVKDRLFPSNYIAKTSQQKIKRDSVQNGGLNMEELRGVGMFTHSDETESESSEQDDVEEDINPWRRNLGFSRGASEGCGSASVKSVTNPTKANMFLRKNKQSCRTLGVKYSSKNGVAVDEQLLMSEGIYSSKGGKKGKTRGSRYLHNHVTGDSVNNGHMQLEYGEKLHQPAERKQKGRFDHDYSVPLPNHMQDYSDNEEDELHVAPRLVGNHSVIDNLGKKVHERPNMSLSGCNSLTKKRKGKTDVTYRDALDESDLLHSSPQEQSGEPKWSIRNMEVESDYLANLVKSEPHIEERGLADVEPETPAKPFTLITPTVHTGFSFSIMHLLSAVRVAMITPLAEDVYENTDACILAQGHKNLPSLTVQEIVNRVRSNPGDPCILETQEPLQDLVRGVLKIFSSKTAPLGAKGWKTLIFYEKSSKSWTWIGPVSSRSSDPDIVDEETSSMAWGLPHKMLVKLVDSFANWLKSGQETLQLIGSLPAPPFMFMQPNLDEKERFRDLRAQKSLNTISPSSEEVRAYFRKEEILRYLVPDRAFSYTAADGRKSIVAPLRRCGGKLTSKARDHFMLKPDRPPHVTVLCLVRDAAARLPGSIGTRADVCTLIRDSQYIVENVGDAQINQVVSGALDRLHYERDPCVQFDSDRKLWVYLHRDREEEDFEDDGTSSTKKWKRPRKNAPEQSDQGTVNVAYHGTREQLTCASAAAYELGSGLYVEPSSMYAGEGEELLHNDLRSNGEENHEPFVGLARRRVIRGHPIGWEAHDLNSFARGQNGMS
ncbi:Nuclear factor related to kappa-B-binding protein [Macleaya cordata]|uniref:Nuclear factor related to kappa-B-binding protein n=1 Tax=Macleaya cordata TaxID=56857 RepID=A0A200R662_MACCD|nr:Nuclear factor related to kappa-B-binding protein [Macleaya cordata]